MVEAYKVGVSISLAGNVASVISQLIREFETLNRSVKAVQMSVNEMAAGMRGLGRIGDNAARSWKEAASAMERAARAARSAGSAMPGGGGGGTGYTYTPPGRPANTNGRTTFLALPAPTGGGMVPYNPSGGGTFAGGPGSYQGALVPYNGGNGGGGGGGPIPLNYKAPGSRAPWVPPGHHDLAMASVGFGGVAAGGGTFLEAAMNARIQTDVVRNYLRMQGFGDKDIAKADEIAQKLQLDVPSATIAGGLNIVRDLLTVTQNKGESLDYDAVKSFAETDVVLRSLGLGQEGAQLFKAMQAGELRGVLTDPKTHKISIDRLQKFLKNVQITAAQTGGRVGPAEVLQLLRSAGIEGGMLSDDTLFKDLITPILSMGAAGAGTGLQGFAMQFVGGKMSEGAGLMLAQAGLLNLPKGAPDPKNKGAMIKFLRDHYKNGIGHFLFPPEVSPYANEAAKEPVEFVLKRLLPSADKYMKDHHITPKDDDELLMRRQQYITALMSRIPGAKIAGDVIRNILLIQRDRDAIDAARKRFAAEGKSPMESVVAHDPRIQIDAFHASMNALLEQLGGTVMKDALDVLRNFTKGLNAITDWARANPKAADTLIHFAEGLTAVSGALFVVAGGMLVIAPMVTVMKSLGSGVGKLGAGLATFAAGGEGAVGLMGLITLLSRLAAVGVFLGIMKPGKANAGEEEELKKMREDPAYFHHMMGDPNIHKQSYRAPSADPNHVQKVRVINAVDIARGTTSYMGDRASYPQRGPTGPDGAMTPSFPRNMGSA